jgi:methyl-accepting chemotaxis protein
MNWFKNLKISGKLLTGFTFASVIAVLIGVICFNVLNKMIDGKNQIYNENLLPIKNLGYANAALLIQRGDIRAMLTVKTAPEREKYKNSCLEQDKVFQEYLTKFAESTLSDKEKDLVSKIQSSYSAFGTGREKFFQAALNSKDDEAIALLNGELTTNMGDTRKNLRAMIDLNSEDAVKISAILDSQASSGNLTVIIAVILSVSLMMGFGIYVSRLISKPVKEATNMMEELGKGHLKTRANVTSQDEIGNMIKIQNEFADKLDSFVKVMYKVSEGKLDERAASLSDNDEISPALNKIISVLFDLKEETEKMAKAFYEGETEFKGDEAKFNGEYKNIITGFNQTVHNIIAIIREGYVIMDSLSHGDLTVRLHGEFRGNYKRYQEYINTLGESLENLVTKINDSVHAVSSASAQISSSTEEMAAGAQEQSAQASEVATATEQMTTTIFETTKNADSAAQAAKKSGVIAKEGGDVVYETIEGIVRISEVVKKSADTVQTLGQNSDKIGEIVQVIDDIADQTNLLALNAAIEAARAGEQGRGFAVVADEVRKLAERTTKATKEIATMIKEIQKDTTEAVDSMQEGTKEVEKGKVLAHKAGESLKQIISGTEQVVDMVSQVASASQEQSSAVEQISKNIESISSVTTQSASGVQQIAKAASDLNRLTENLQDIVSKFKVEDGGVKQVSSVFQEKGSTFVRSNGHLVNA